MEPIWRHQHLKKTRGRWLVAIVTEANQQPLDIFEKYGVWKSWRNAICVGDIQHAPRIIMSRACLKTVSIKPQLV